MSGARDERGAATAELALGIPLLLSLTIGLVWLLGIGIAQVRMVDAAREAARAAARGDPSAAAVGRALHVAPGAQVSVSEADGELRAAVSDTVAPPGGLLAFLPAVRVHAQATTAVEVAP
ncbi:MAG: TadE family type IV pilus minor pilin [Nocardioides sp.]